MLKKLSWSLWVIVFMLAIPVVPSLAQEDTPLIVSTSGGLFIGDANGINPFLACSPGEVILTPLKMLPDGRGIIIMTQPKEVTDIMIEMGGVGGAVLPNNIYYCDLTTLTLYLLAGQPDNFLFFDEGGGDNGFSRSYVEISPDGNSVTWSEVRFPSFETSITTLDLVTFDGMMRDILMPETFGIPAPPFVLWLEGGIGVLAYTFDEETFEALMQLHYYQLDVDGNLTGDAPFIIELSREGEMSEFIDAFLPITYQGQTQLAMRYSVSGWALLDVTTGEQMRPSGLPARISAQSQQGVTLYYDIGANYSMNWRAVGANERDFINYRDNRIAISPDGQRVAFAGDVLELWDNRSNTVSTIANTGVFADDYGASILWGGMTWVWLDDGVSVENIIMQCEGTQASRLSPNTLARVVQAGVPNNVRSAPTTSGELIGQLSGGATFTVLSMPICSDGYAWYQVQFGDLIGWTAEGTQNAYWLEPLQ